MENSIAAVTVYPTQARVTRRAREVLQAGEQTVEIGPLPMSVDADSVRVTGRGAATVLGVDVVLKRNAEPSDAGVAELDAERKGLVAEIAALDDDEAVLRQRQTFLTQLGERASGAFARALAPGDAVTGFTATMSAELADVLAGVRAVQRRREELAEQIAVIARRLQDLSGKREPDTRFAVVALNVAETGPVELDVIYQVVEAGWRSTYDVRLTGGTLRLTWFGLIDQHTGEDWPDCELALSTARPSGRIAIPELDPWFLDVYRPAPPPMPRSAGYGGAPWDAAPMMSAAPGAAPAPAPQALTAASFDGFAELAVAEAVVEDGPVAATYRPARTVPVPSDGTTARATISVLVLEARLDHIVAPSRSPEVQLRAVVKNTSGHTLPPGSASIFHEADFVVKTELATWAPGEERELALGLDDRVRVERELSRSTATKATIGSTRRREVEYVTKVGNYTGRPIDITVLDQVPVSRHDAITVKETVAEPGPAERTELGVLTWRLRIADGQTAAVKLGYRVESKNVQIAGWRE